MSFDDDYDYEPEEIILHPTKGVYIINALTGKETKCLVGSKDERRFWKVIDSRLSSYDPTPKTRYACPSKAVGSAQGSKTYFFLSPEDDELILEKTVDENLKKAWRQKRLKVSKVPPW